MKKFIALAREIESRGTALALGHVISRGEQIVTLGVSVSARAQWIVFDPTMNVRSILNTAQEVAKFVEMINNQVQQVQTLTDQLNEFKHYEDLFGDPKAVLLTTVRPPASVEVILNLPEDTGCRQDSQWYRLVGRATDELAREDARPTERQNSSSILH